MIATSTCHLRRYLQACFAAVWVIAVGAGFGAPASAQTQETFQDWQVVCVEAGVCNAHHTSPDNLARIVIGPGKDGAGHQMAFLIAPKATAGSPAGLLIQGKGILPLKVRECSEQACIAVPPAEAVSSAINDLMERAEAIIAYQAGNRMIIARLSLMGMSAALSKLPD